MVSISSALNPIASLTFLSPAPDPQMTHIKSSAPLDNLKCLVTSFIAKLSYNPPKSSSLRRMMLQNALQTEVESWNIQVESEKHDYIYRVCIQSAAMAEVIKTNTRTVLIWLIVPSSSAIMIIHSRLSFKSPGSPGKFDQRLL